jgi:uncharacterized membrane protein YfcA
MDSMLALVAVGAIAAGFVQGLSGFGFGMSAMSFWAWSLDPRLAAALAVFGALSGQIIAALTVRRGFSWRALAPFLAGGLAGVPLGVTILPHLELAMFQLGLGLLLALWCPLMLAAGRLPRIRHGGRLADAVAGACGGLMGGLGGFTGVIPTLWCTLRGWPKDEQRAVIQNFNLAALSVTMALYLAQGLLTRAMLPQLAIVGAAMLLPALLGARLYHGISEARFRQIVLGLLTLSGLALLARSLPPLLARL